MEMFFAVWKYSENKTSIGPVFPVDELSWMEPNEKTGAEKVDFNILNDLY